MATLTVRTLPPWVDVFLRELRETGLERTAAAAAGTTLKQVRGLAETNEEFKYALEDALERATDVLELEARRRAVDGVEKGVYYQGVRMDTEVVYSDALLTTLLKAKRAAFADKTHVVGSGRDGAIEIVVRQFGAPAPAPTPTGEVIDVEAVDITPSPASPLAGGAPETPTVTVRQPLGDAADLV